MSVTLTASSGVGVLVTPLHWEAHFPLTFTHHVKCPFPLKEILAKIKNKVAFGVQMLSFRLTECTFVCPLKITG